MSTCAALLMAVALQAQSAQQPYRYPGDDYTPPLVCEIADIGDVLNIKFKVNGVEGIFMLDTGSFGIRIAPEFAAKAKLPITEEDDVKKTKINFDFGRVSESAEAIVQPIGVKDDGTPGRSRLAGIIGLEALRDRCLGIDTVNKKVTIWPYNSLGGPVRELYFKAVPYNVPGEGVRWALPGANFTYRGIRFQNRSGKLRPFFHEMESEDSTENQDHYRLASAVNGKPVTLAFDTGAGMSMVRKGLTDWGRIAVLGKITAYGIDTNWEGKLAIADSLAFADRRDAAVPLLLVRDDFPLAGLIGYDRLRGTRVLLEFTKRNLWMASDSQTSQGPDYLLPFGIRLIQHGRGLFLGVVPGQFAAKAGLQSGDQIISLDGNPIKVVEVDSEKEPSGVFSTNSGARYPSTVEIVAKRGSKTLRRVLRR